MRRLRHPAPLALGLLLVAAPGAARAEPDNPARPAAARAVRWIVAAGGSTPDLNQVAIEADAQLAAEVLGGGGVLLFGGGAGSRAVQVAGRREPGDALLLRLGRFFAPREGREGHYRETRVAADAAADLDSLMAALSGALAQGSTPLTLYLGGHGEVGATPAENAVALWGYERLTVTDLAAALDKSGGRRPVRVVMTTCFSGGFAEIVFPEARSELGFAATPRCGLFAATWDLEASGCDSNPDRRTHEGYGVHFLHALRGEDRHGRRLPPAEIDLDGDGAISLLEAHTRVRVASEAFDVPTSTTERWLRHAAPEEGPSVAVALPEEDAVVRALAARVRLSGREEEARGALERLEHEIEAVEARLEEEQRRYDKAWYTAAAATLARWPVLDDPWHPDFAPTLRSDRAAIDRFTQSAKPWRAYTTARDRYDALALRKEALRLQAAPYERLVRALDNRLLAGRLKASGSPDWRHFQALLACERGLP